MNFKLNIKQLLLIDAAGAMVSAIMLGIVLVYFEDAIGMNPNVLYILATIAFVFFNHSLIGALSKHFDRKKHLRKVASANLLYCGLTLGLMIYFSKQLTTLGMAYFIAEILIVVILSWLELNQANN